MPDIHTVQKGVGYWCHSEQSSSTRPGEVPGVPSMMQGIHVDTWTKALITTVRRAQRVALLTKHAYPLANCIALWAPADCTDLSPLPGTRSLSSAFSAPWAPQSSPGRAQSQSLGSALSEKELHSRATQGKTDPEMEVGYWHTVQGKGSSVKKV